MTPRFDDLGLKGAEVRHLRVSPGKSLALELLLLPQAKAGKREVRAVELTFEGLHRYEIRTDAAPWLEVVSWREVKDSHFRASFSPHPLVEGLSPTPIEDIGHFEIVFDVGSINLLAENWSMRTIETFPVQDGPSCSR
jgi:hypothetical protein